MVSADGFRAPRGRLHGKLAGMPYDIRPLTDDDVPALSRFLTEGFHSAPDAPFASPDVLRWKYLEPGPPRSWVACDEQGRLVGHLGICPTAFRGRALPEGEVATLHMIDWLSAAPGSGVGARLMLRAHRGVPTGYGFGGSDAGRAVGGGGGYALVGTVPAYSRVLRPAHAWRAGRVRQAARDLLRTVQHPPRAPRAALTLRPVQTFGPEIEPILDAYERVVICTDRRPAALNRLLRYPRGGITGWLLAQGDRVRGFALLSLVTQGATRAGKLVDCVLDDLDPNLWHAACWALAAELARQGADTATACASTPWTAEALRASGFGTRHALEFRLRDKEKRIPAGAVFHLTPFEADYAYT